MKNERILEYLQTHVRDIYKSFDGCHDERHFDEVYNACEEMGRAAGLTESNRILLQVAAAFHDIGRIVGDDNHELYSCDIFKRDRFIINNLDPDEIALVSLVIKQHRSKYESRLLMSNILKDADKISRIDRYRSIYRVVAYNCDHFKDAPDLIDIIMGRINRNSMKKRSWNTEVAQSLYGDIPIYGDIPRDEIMQIINEYIG